LYDERSVYRNTFAVESENFEFVCFEWFCEESSLTRPMISADQSVYGMPED